AQAGRCLPISELGNPCESLHQRPFSEGGKGPSWGCFSVDPSEKGNFGNFGFEEGCKPRGYWLSAITLKGNLG
ncbi:TPA: hypothetical protein ACLEB9_006588, partial [Pseudomonas aeruginosa]